MPFPPPHREEEERLRTLERYQILDTLEDAQFDEIAELCAAVCDVPISLVTLLDRHRQWFKAHIGLEERETERDCSFCAYAVAQEDCLLVSDATADPRFVENRLVYGSKNFRFYAGVPLRAYNGLPLGTLCVIDHRPRTLEPAQQAALQTLGRQVEARLELWRMHVEKERLARFVVHDLKNPLTSMLMNAELAAENLEADGQPAHQVRELSVATSTMHRMVLDLQDLFARDTGALTPVYEAVDLAALVTSLQTHAHGRLRAQKVTLESRIDSEAQRLTSDPELLRRILENLVYNALEVAPAGSTIAVRATREADRVILRVEDEGPGVPEAERERIFELDYRSAATKRRGSRGIGLAFCRVATEALGGSIACEPLDGQGASFRVDLPARVS